MLNRVLARSHIQIAMLVLILALGAFFRFNGLTTQSLWNDELSSWSRSNYVSLTEVIDEGVRPDVHPPGYQVLLYFVEHTIGDSEAILRLPSALAGIFSILLIFLIGRRLYTYREGLLAAAFMACLWCPIYYSQEARAYSLLLLFTLLVTYFWIDIMANLRQGLRVSPYAVVAYVVTASVASYLHYYGLYLTALQGMLAAFILRRKGRALLPLFAIYGLIALAYLPWMPAMVTQFGSGGVISAPEPTAFVSYMRFLFNKSGLLLLIAGALYGFALLKSFHNFRKTGAHSITSVISSPTLLLSVWLIVPFTLVYLVSITAKPILTNRNLIISLPTAYLLLARAITHLPISRLGQTVVAFSVTGLFVYHLLFGLDYYSAPQKEQFREAVGFVVDQIPLYQDSLIIGYAWNPDYLNYYFKKRGSDQRVNVVAGQKEDISIVAQYVQTEHPTYIWYITAHRTPGLGFINYLDQNFTVLDHKAFIGANVWLFETAKSFKKDNGRSLRGVRYINSRSSSHDCLKSKSKRTFAPSESGRRAWPRDLSDQHYQTKTRHLRSGASSS